MFGLVQLQTVTGIRSAADTGQSAVNQNLMVFHTDGADVVDGML